MNNRVLITVIGISVFVATVAIGFIIVGGGSSDDRSQNGTSVTSTQTILEESTTIAGAGGSTTVLDGGTTIDSASVSTTTQPDVPETVTTTVPAMPPMSIVDCSSGYSDREVLPLVPCSKGFGVSLLQNSLNDAGYSVDADGYYGQGTASAVMSFQADNGLPATGVADRETWKAIVGTRPGVDIDGDGVIGPNEITYD